VCVCVCVFYLVNEHSYLDAMYQRIRPFYSTELQ
jgi:hypothetical protein